MLAAALVACASEARAGDLVVTVLDGGLQRPQGVEGAVVSLEGTGHADTTDVRGNASIASVSSGLYVLRVTGPAGFDTVRFVVQVPAAGTLTVPPLLLPRIPTGVSVTVPTSGGVVTATTQVESTLVPDARLTVPSGTTITGASGDDPPIAIYPVDRSLSPAPFPGELEPVRLYAVSTGGLGFSQGLDIRLPNDLGLPPGTTVDVYGLVPSTGVLSTGWVRIGTATVDVSETFLASDTAFVTSATLLALDAPTALPTTYRVYVEDWEGNPVSDATVQVNRLLLTETSTPGVYEGSDVVATGAPVRALVSKDFGSGLVLHALTDPVFVTGHLTELHRGRALRLSLTADGVSTAGGVVRNTGTNDADHLLTEATIGVVAGWGSGADHETEAGPLAQTFFGSVAPIVSFVTWPQGTSGAPEVAAIQSFTIHVTDMAFDPDSASPYTSTARVTSASFSLDAGATWHPAKLLAELGDARGPLCAPPGGNQFLYAWDMWSSPPPSGITGGAQEVRLRVSVIDEPGGHEVTTEAPAFHYAWPPAGVARITPPPGATGVFKDTEIFVDFLHDMDPTSISGATITLAEDGVGTISTATVTYLAATRQAKITVAGDLPADSKLTVTVGTGVQNVFGLGASSAYVSGFETNDLRGLDDDDGDTLLNLEELAYGTDPNLVDTDGDGWSDAYELYVSGTSPTSADTDGDGTPDAADSTPLGTPEAPLPVADPAPVATFLVTDISPRGGVVRTDAKIVVTFNNPVNPLSVTSSNVVLNDGSSDVPLTVLDQPNPRTLLLQPSSLSPSTTYTLTLSSGSGAVEDMDGTPLHQTAYATFQTGASTTPLFEATHYMETLARTRWERFPLTAATANGRQGVAVVIPSTHKLLLTETDVVTPGRGQEVAITRIYRNNEVATALDSGFGNHWFFPYDRRFEAIASVDTDSTVDLRHRSADGRTFEFQSGGAADFHDFVNPPGFYDNKNGTYDQLRAETSDGVTYLVQRARDGTKSYYRFWRGSTPVNASSASSLQPGDVGVLVKVVDRNLNTVTITRHSPSDPDRPHRIDTIVDDLGRVTTFTYSSETGKKDLVVAIAQFQGDVQRAWAYVYDSSRNLVEVIPPIASRKREYTYSLNAGVYNLTSVVDGRGNTSMRFVYDGANDVIQVDYGSGQDAGTAVYAYSVTSGVTKATQIDRNGNVCVLEHEDVRTAPFQNISKATTFTRGLHSGAGGGAPEPSEYATLFTHDDDSELILIQHPGNVEEFYIREKCGCVCQCGIRNALDPYLAIIWNFAYEPVFKGLIRITEPRGFDPSEVGFGSPPIVVLENILEQIPRRLIEANYFRQDAFTTYIYYDHENVAARMEQDLEAFGGSVQPWFNDVSMPLTYGGDPGGGGLHLPLGGVFDVDDDGRIDRGGNPVAIRGPRPVEVANCSLTGNRQAIERFMSYNQFGQRAFTVEPDGTWNRSEFYTSGPMKGYLKQIELDTNWRDTDTGFDVATGTVNPSSTPSLTTKLQQTITFEYDAFGNVTKRTNGRGHAWTTEHDLLNMVVKTIAPAPFLYERTFTYDENNNLVTIEVQNVVPNDLDDNGIQDGAAEQRFGAKATFTHTFAYNTANSLVRAQRDAFDGAPNFLVTTYQYDRKQLRVGVREPEGNSHWTRYDERDLVYEQIDGASDMATARITRYDYDANGNLTHVLDADGNSIPAQVIEYDGLDRPVKWTDELGNFVQVAYNAAGQVTERKVKGQARSRTDSPSTWLEHTITRYDEAGRAFQVAQELFGVNSGETLADTVTGLGYTRLTPAVAESPSSRVDPNGEYVYTLFAHDVRSNLVGICDDNGHHTHFDYDALDRLIKETDELGSERIRAYDAASNVIRVTESEKRADTGALDGVFYTETFYDELDRPIVTVSHLGNTRRAMYDSRNNLVAASDAMGLVGSADLSDLPSASEHGTFPQLVGATSPAPVATINERGNTTRFFYDGIGRLIRTERDLRQDGTGASLVVGQIVTQTVWDGNGRVRSRIDPNGNATLYVYDHQNRLIREIYADGTDKRLSWNPVGTLAAEVDARGTVKSYAYDALERRSDMTVTNVPQGAGQTTFAAWDYDGLGRRTRAEDDDSIVETWYDSLSRRVAETLAVGTGAPRTAKNQSLSAAVSGTVLRAYDGVGNLLKQTYPSGHVLERRYDGVDRLAFVRDGFGSGKALSTFVHAGMGARRLMREYNPTGQPEDRIRQTLTYDGERRVVGLNTVRDPLGLPFRIVGFGYAWDRENNRRYERRLLSGNDGPGEAYRYDSAYRLIRDDREVPDGALDAIPNNATTVPAVPYVVANVNEYVLDAAGNRHQTTFGGVTQSYAMAARDRAMNQYTTIGNVVRSHDPVGNLIGSTDTGRQAFYDADNRLVQWTEGTKDVRYRYDVDGRRILKEDASNSPSFLPTITFWDGWQEVEEYVPNGAGGWALNKRYVYGEGIDEVLRATLPDVADVDGDSVTSEHVDLYYHHNSLGSVVAVTETWGTVVERYRYSAYGTPTIYDKSGNQVSTTQVQQPFMFTGRRWDFEEASGLYYYRLRYYDPAAGRFISRDPLGIWGDPGQVGNGQSYCGQNPVNRTDPSGLGWTLTWTNPDGSPRPIYDPIIWQPDPPSPPAPKPATPPPAPPKAAPAPIAGVGGMGLPDGPKVFDAWYWNPKDADAAIALYEAVCGLLDMYVDLGGWMLISPRFRQMLEDFLELRAKAARARANRPRTTPVDDDIIPGPDLTVDEVYENMAPDRLTEAMRRHGPPETWTYKGDKKGSGVLADSEHATEGTTKHYEVWVDAEGREFELHYFMTPEGDIEDLKRAPRTRSASGSG